MNLRCNHREALRKFNQEQLRQMVRFVRQEAGKGSRILLSAEELDSGKLSNELDFQLAVKSDYSLTVKMKALHLLISSRWNEIKVLVGESMTKIDGRVPLIIKQVSSEAILTAKEAPGVIGGGFELQNAGV
ncbi:hypothetical protein CCACVL1_14729 [Corchorus capsularis]|uniref:Uncharacterized protein n=1 Tax=Corchorus capsularis TaxID=210143 RepID=A0A1R3I5U6_COCAP|nr:hypothetical protein CCACVL1_14729 [Corchorus capsularis]